MSSHPQHTKGHQYALNGLLYVLIVCAVGLGAAAGWMRYSQKRSCGFSDAAEQAMGGLLPDINLAGRWLPAGGMPQNSAGVPMSRFACPQCQSYCWTWRRGRCPACPFCGRAMVGEDPGVLPVAGTAAVGTASPIPIQAGVMATHDNRGACMNCHTAVRSVNSGLAPMIQSGVTSPHRNRGTCTACHSVVRANGLGPVPTIQADAVAPHPDRGGCANCHIVAKLNAAVLNPAATAQNTPQTQWRGVAAPPITADAVKPILIKPFGIEACPAPGEGAKITGVMGNSNASKAGLLAGDIVVEFNGKKVSDAEGLQQLVSQAAPEANAQLKIMRNDRLQKVAVMVGEGEMEGFTPIQKP